MDFKNTSPIIKDINKSLSVLNEDFVGQHAFGMPTANVGFDNGSYNIFDLKDEVAFGLLDTFARSIGEQTYLNPYTPIQRLRDKLSVVGLQFNVPNYLTEGKDSYTFPLKQFGGRFGKLKDESRDVGRDDGIAHRLGYGLALKVECKKTETGRWTVKAEFVKSRANNDIRPGITDPFAG